MTDMKIHLIKRGGVQNAEYDVVCRDCGWTSAFYYPNMVHAERIAATHSCEEES